MSAPERNSPQGKEPGTDGTSMSNEIETPATPSTGPSRRPVLRRALMVGAAVVALVVASIGVSGISSAEPMPAPVDVSVEATPATSVVGTTVEIVGEVVGLELTSTSDGVVAACGDVEATTCGDWPTGDYSLKVAGTEVAAGQLGESGLVEWSSDELPVGTHKVSFTYEGDHWFEPGSAATSITITEPEPTPATPGGSYGDASTKMTSTAGGQVPVRGEGWMPESEVTVTMRSEPVVLGTAAVGAEGTFAQTYTIPVGTAAGAHTITLSGTGADGQPASVVLDLTVVAAASAARPAAAPSSLAFTG
jgi:hypothetical protein